MASRRDVTWASPEDHPKLRLSKVKKSAAGIPAAVSSIVHGITRMGVPTTAKSLMMVNQQSGFDCPGCAWPDPENPTAFEFCENGAKAVADEATKARITERFFSKYSVSELSKKSDRWLNAQGRLTQPMYLPSDSDYYQVIKWGEALDLIASRLDVSNPNRAVFYTSGRTSNEAAFLYQLLARQLGTNNLPDCSNMCHESSGKALNSTIGIGKGTVRLRDFTAADLIIVMGQNPGTNHPRMLTALRDAKRSGAKIIHINPLPESGLSRFKHPQDYMSLKLGDEALSDLHLPVKIGGDAALLHGIMRILLEKDSLDHEFISKNCEGFESFAENILSTSWDRIVLDSGLDRSQIELAAKMCADSKATIACWAMGLTQHKNGVAVIQEVVNLLLMGGHFGRSGAGACPVRGHSNVQGDRTMGIWEKPSDSFLTGIDSAMGITSPRTHGLDVVESIKAMDAGNVDSFICMGGNFLSATPDTEIVARALSKVGLTVQISTKLNRSHLVTGNEAIILPVLGRTERYVNEIGEQIVSVENSMGIVHTSIGGLTPASKELRAESWIVGEIGRRLFGDSPINWSELSLNHDLIRDSIADSIPGFERYNERVREPNGFELPNPPRDSTTFNTASGKAHFTTHNIPDLDIPEGSYVMMTIRSHDQYNTTIYDVHDRYRGIHGRRRVVLMNAEDMVQRGWRTRDKVNLVSHFNGEKRQSDDWQLIAYPIPRGNIATYFPEANSLVPLDSTAAISNTPTSKWIIVTIHDAEEEE